MYRPPERREILWQILVTTAYHGASITNSWAQTSFSDDPVEVRFSVPLIWSQTTRHCKGCLPQRRAGDGSSHTRIETPEAQVSLLVRGLPRGHAMPALPQQRAQSYRCHGD